MLSGFVIQQCQIPNCKILDSDLSLVRIRSVHFEDTKIEGPEFTVEDAVDVKIIKSNIDVITFGGIFRDCEIIDTTFHVPKLLGRIAF